MLIALDTSTTQSGLACYEQNGLLGECAWHSGRNHTAHILSQLDMLLRHIDRRPAEIQAVAVATGPGSWSGLRVGLSIAKGIALAGSVPIIGMGTLDALAYQHHRPFMSIYPLIRLGRERFATAEFLHGEAWQRLSDYRNVSLDELCDSIHDHTMFCGDIDTTTREELRRRIDGQAYFPGAPANLRRPGYLAYLGWQRFAAADYDDTTSLEPIYLGEPAKPPPAAPPTGED